MSARIFIDGAVGTTGLEIRDRLAGRGDIDLLVLPEERRKDAAARADALAAADLVILCLPDDAAREAVALLAGARTRIIDASSAHRTDTGWTYGFAELEPGRAAEIAAATRLSNPGCYPTGFLALVRPLVRAGLLPASHPFTINAVSGYSGGGRPMIEHFEAPGAPAFQAYALGLAHKHVPEMQAHGGLALPPLFAPAVVATYRGMLVEVPLQLDALPGAPTPAQLHACLADSYADAPLIRVAPLADPPATLDVAMRAGSDGIDLHVLANPVTGQARLVAALDNLGKGAAGAAVQNLNLMIGADPLTGLRV